jgi:transcriptional regulator with XRE-family HTH domain
MCFDANFETERSTPMTPRSFGDVLRQLRREANKTLGDVARVLGVSTVYLSDIERGNRKPFARERILRIAEFLDKDPSDLLEAADQERGVIEYDINNARPLEAKVVGGLVTGLARGGISDDQLNKIQDILKEQDK